MGLGLTHNGPSLPLQLTCFILFFMGPAESGNIDEFSMVLLNNTLSLPLRILLAYIFSELYIAK